MCDIKSCLLEMIIVPAELKSAEREVDKVNIEELLDSLGCLYCCTTCILTFYLTKYRNVDWKLILSDIAQHLSLKLSSFPIKNIASLL